MIDWNCLYSSKCKYLVNSYTLFLWDINKQKSCQSFQFEFFYLDSLSNALSSRILNSIDQFRICLLNCTANPAHFHQSLAGLALLFSRKLQNCSHDFFQTFSIYFFNYFIKNPQTTIAPTFLTHIISAIGGVTSSQLMFVYIFL